MNYSNIGIYYDLIYALTGYFNGSENESCKFLNLSEITDSIMAFFYEKEKGNSFMQNILYESYDDLLITNNIEVIQNKLIDYENTVKLLISFFFGDIKIDVSLNNYMFIYHINKEITKSDYPDKLKSALYSFFIEPVKTIHELLRSLMELNLQLKRLYKNHSSAIYKIQQEIDQSKVLNKLKLSDKLYQSIFYAICLLDNKCLRSFPIKNGVLLLIGEDYNKSLEGDNKLDLKDFGYVLTEMNRIEILNMMNSKGELTIKDIEQKLCLSGTNAYYHLSLMTKSGIVKTRYKGRTVFYSINKPYLKELCLKISDYCNE